MTPGEAHVDISAYRSANAGLFEISGFSSAGGWRLAARPPVVARNAACANGPSRGCGARIRAWSLLVYLIALFFVGLVVGSLARLLLPGPDPMGIGVTALVGLCGTFSAGLFSWYVLHRHGAGLVLSLLFSMLVVWIYRRSRGGAYRRTTPGGS